MKKRLWYVLATLLLLSVEICIALFVHDRIIRPYVGDILVVIVLYTFVKIIFPSGHWLLPLWIFMFAAVVEFLQLIHIADLLKINSRFLRILIGSSFDVKDIVCYAVGCGLTGFYDHRGKNGHVKQSRKFWRESHER